MRSTTPKSRGEKLASAYLRAIRRKAARNVTDAEASAIATEVARIVWERKVLR